MSLAASVPEAGAPRALARVSVISAAVEAPELDGVCEALAAGAFPGATLGERLNAAAAVSQGDYLLFLGEGVTLRPDALDALVAPLEADTTIGAVCGKLVASDGHLLSAGGIVWRDVEIEPYGNGADPDDSAYAFARDVDFGSMRCLLVRRSVFVPFDAALDSPAHLGADACLSLAAAGLRTRYVPGAVANVPLGRTPIVADPTGLAPSQETLGRLRAAVAGTAAVDSSAKRVLVIGVYLANRLSNVGDSVRALASERHEIVQHWIGLGGDAPTADVAGVTAAVVLERTPKYALLNRLLEQEDLDGFDTVIVTDDDVVFPHGFVDAYLSVKEAAGFQLAQPARTRGSYVDHPIVLQQRNLLARRTQFVEIGPVVSVNRSIYPLVFPHDLDNEMGWGFDQVWARELRDRGIPMGIVDATPVDHSIRKPVEHYEHTRADMQRRSYLEKREHLALEDCFRVLDIFPVREAA